jgi:hypothetical protein
MPIVVQVIDGEMKKPGSELIRQLADRQVIVGVVIQQSPG